MSSPKTWKRSAMMVTLALAAVLTWVALSVSPAIAHESDSGAPAGQLREPGADLPPFPGYTGRDNGTGGPDDGGLNADPDTFEIDSWKRGAVEARPGVDEPRGAARPSLLFNILAWIHGVLSELERVPGLSR